MAACSFQQHGLLFNGCIKRRWHFPPGTLQGLTRAFHLGQGDKAQFGITAADELERTTAPRHGLG